MEEQVKDGMHKIIFREPMERPKHFAKLQRGSPYMARELSPTFSHINTTQRSQYKFQPSTTREFMNQRTIQSLIDKHISIMKTYKTR